MDQEQRLDQEQEQAQNIVFKTTAVGGFEKRAVLDYIYEINEKMEIERIELLGRIGDLEEARQSLEENSTQYNNKMRTLERDLASVSNELSNEKHQRLELEGSSNDFTSEIERYKKQIEDLKKQKQAPKERTPEETERFKQLEQLEIKQGEIEKASYQLGRVMLDARADADDLVDTAKEQAGNMVAAAKEDAQNILAEANSKSIEIIASAEKSAEEIVNTANIADERIRSEAKKADENIRSEAKKADENIRSEANKYSEVKISAANAEVDRVMSNAKENITEMIIASEEVARVSDRELSELKNETDSINSSLEDAIAQLINKTAKLDKIILAAKSRITSEQSQMAKNKLADISGMTVSELEEIASIKADYVVAEPVGLKYELAEESDETQESPAMFLAPDITATEESIVMVEEVKEKAAEDQIELLTYESPTLPYQPEENTATQVASEGFAGELHIEDYAKITPETLVAEEINTASYDKVESKEAEENKSFQKQQRDTDHNPHDYNTQLKSTIEDNPAKPAIEEESFDFTSAEPATQAEFNKVAAENEELLSPMVEDLEYLNVKPEYEEDGIYAPREENDNPEQPDQPVGSQSGLLDFTV